MPAVTCTKCGFVLDEAVFNRMDWVKCSSCRTPLRVEVFPALFRDAVPTPSGRAIAMDGEAGCFYHPQKKALLPCEACGRFLCALCDVELNGQHLCPACLETGKKKGRLSNLDTHRTLYDSLALTLALVPVLFWPLTVITAPAVLFIGIRHWNSPRSIVGRSKFRLVVAILIAVLQMVGWGILIWVLLRARHVAR